MHYRGAITDMWVAPFSRVQTISLLMIGLVSGCVPALQPLLLGGLLAEGRISGPQIGHAATVEGLGMALATGIASLFFMTSALRRTALIAILGCTCANIATLLSTPLGIIAARGLSGACNGILLWLIIGMINRTQTPARLFAIYITAQATTAFLLSATFATLALPASGVIGCYGMLALLNLLLLPLLRRIPKAYAPLTIGRDSATMRLPPFRGRVGLLAITLNQAGVMVVWIYLLPIGLQSGQPPAAINAIVSAAIFVRIGAGILAMVFAPQVNGPLAILCSALASIAALTLLQLSSSNTLWLLATIIFAFSWMFAQPFHIALLNRLDPSNRSAMLVSTAELLGIAAGPFIGSIVIRSNDFQPALQASIACYLVVVIAATAALRSAHP